MANQSAGTAVMDAQQDSRMDFKVIFALFLVHFIGDFFMAFISPLLPVLAEKLSLSLTQVGFVTGTSMIAAFIIQPTVGYMADRFRTRFFILGGPLLTAIFIPLFGWAGGFATLIMFAAIGSIGQSMFHPPAAGMVPEYAGRRLGFSMAMFVLGGTVAFGIGPLFASWYVSTMGLSNLPYCGLVGAATVAALFVLVPRPEGEGLKNMGFIGSIRDALGSVWKPLLVIWFIIVFRVYVVQTIMTFVPMMLTKEGYDLVTVGGIISAFVVAGSISSVLAGALADRVGFKPIFLVSYLLASPCLYLFFKMEGRWIFVGSFLAGFFTLASIPLATAMAQTFVQRGKSLVASLTMGLAFGTGGVLTPLTGKMADLYTIRAVLGVVIWIPLLATVLILFLPKPSDFNNAKAD
jgi:FSR family fosmidomycin resistance protein-like MFS transporter